MATHPTKDVYAQEAAQIVNTGSRVLDVRTSEEFTAGHIKGAVNVPLLNKTQGVYEPNPDFAAGVKEKFPDTDEQFVVHCQGGGRSRKACNQLMSVYTKLVHLEGGLSGWISEGLPTEK